MLEMSRSWHFHSVTAKKEKKVITYSRPPWLMAQLVAHQTGDQEVESSLGAHVQRYVFTLWLV